MDVKKEVNVAEFIIDAIETLRKRWGSDGDKVIELCHRSTPFNGSFKEWLTMCTPCGGDWGAWFLSGVKELYPDVWDAIPDDMGHNSIEPIACTLILLGVRTWEA